jgi:hypothetical protein
VNFSGFAAKKIGVAAAPVSSKRVAKNPGGGNDYKVVQIVYCIDNYYFNYIVVI